MPYWYNFYHVFTHKKMRKREISVDITAGATQNEWGCVWNNVPFNRFTYYTHFNPLGVLLLFSFSVCLSSYRSHAFPLSQTFGLRDVAVLLSSFHFLLFIKLISLILRLHAFSICFLLRSLCLLFIFIYIPSRLPPFFL